MRSFKARFAALLMVAISCVSVAPAAKAEVGGFHLNITPYGGFATWDEETNVQDKFLYGGRLGLGFGRYIGVEGTWGQSKSQTHDGLGYQPYVSAPAALPFPPTQDMNVTHIGADLVLNLVPNGAVNPYIQGGWAQLEFSPEDSTDNKETVTGFNVAAGLKLHFSPRVALRLEARDVMTSFSDEQQANGATDKTQSNFFYTGGLQFTIGGESKCEDLDMDGICDKKDECPNTPAGCLVDARGCPIDTDGDGVCDGVDSCAATPKGATVDTHGCPMDSDNDKVFDGLDQCPNTPAGCTVDDKGCPVDSDGDGVCDGLDQCASTTAGCRVDEKGCPVDSDGDGICDGLDLCPNTPAGARVDKDGCPIEITQQETELLDKGVITVRNIYFDTAKWDIKPESNKALQDLCTIFKQWPTLQIEIGGHADSRGKEDYNLDLTDKRANAVLEWFKTNCADANMANFTEKGYGESMPVATNSTKKGQGLNRRVEFKVMNPEELKKIKERREMLMKDSSGK
jgi:outer membrane protein OmpA-like peptidoglycan-associated protein/opacity protein-like surface antigen